MWDDNSECQPHLTLIFYTFIIQTVILVDSDLDPRNTSPQMASEEKSDLLQVYRVVGERIRDERKRQNITQDELAKEIGLTRTSITNVENGRQKLLLHTLFQIADYLGTSPVRLLPACNADTPVRLPDNLSSPIRNWIMHSISSANPKPLKK
jgi:transcriptional regulator with XRE-family HTH domain